MRIKQLHGDFRVEERINLLGNSGAYAYYRVEKQGQTTTAVRNAMAGELKVTPSALVFPSLLDKAAVTVQYASVRKRGSAHLEGNGYTAERIGWGTRALRPSDIQGNHYVAIVRDLAEPEAAHLGQVMERLGAQGLPNYFDDQRFGSLSREGLIGKHILMRDAEKVVRIYLSVPMVGDGREVRAFKRLVSTHWGQWGYLLHQAPRPSNLRSVITYLKDHPHEYRKAANIIQDRLLAIWLSAYQSWVWNLIVANYLSSKLVTPYALTIARRDFPLPEPGMEISELETQMVDLPRLTARYDGDLAPAAKVAFEEEALELRDFKVRILRRVYLTKGEREVAFAPADVEVDSPIADEENLGRQRVTVTFTLCPGPYATLIFKAAAAMVGAEIQMR